MKWYPEALLLPWFSFFFAQRGCAWGAEENPAAPSSPEEDRAIIFLLEVPIPAAWRGRIKQRIPLCGRDGFKQASPQTGGRKDVHFRRYGCCGEVEVREHSFQTMVGFALVKHDRAQNEDWLDYSRFVVNFYVLFPVVLNILLELIHEQAYLWPTPRGRLNYQTTLRSIGPASMFICPPHWSATCHLVNTPGKGKENMHIHNSRMLSGTQNRPQNGRSHTSCNPGVTSSTLCAFSPPLPFCIAFLHFEDLFRVGGVVHDTIMCYLALAMLWFILEPMLLYMVLVYLFVSEHKVIGIILQFTQNRKAQFLFMN